MSKNNNYSNLQLKMVIQKITSFQFVKRKVVEN